MATRSSGRATNWTGIEVANCIGRVANNNGRSAGSSSNRWVRRTDRRSSLRVHRAEHLIRQNSTVKLLLRQYFLKSYQTSKFLYPVSGSTILKQKECRALCTVYPYRYSTDTCTCLSSFFLSLLYVLCQCCFLFLFFKSLAV
jgi:hypothetical protein